MIRPRYLPPDSCLDDPAEVIAPQEIEVRDLAFTMAGDLHARINEWITRGQGGVRQRALRGDIVLLCLRPALFDCQYPSAAWVGREHGVSRQRVALLQQEFAREFGDYIQFRNQRFLNQAGAPRKRRGRERRRKQGCARSARPGGSSFVSTRTLDRE